MSRRALARAGAIGVAAALALAVSTVPGGTQTESAPAGTTVAAVSGHASGAFFEIAADEALIPEPVSMTALGALYKAFSSGDTSGVEALLSSDVGAAALEPIITFGPSPLVTLPAEGGGPFTDSAPSFVLDDGTGGETATLTGALEVSTQGALGTTGFARSTASVTDVNPEELEGLFVIADLIEVECSSDLSGVTGSTHIVDGASLDGPIPTDPAPNTVVFEDSEESDLPEGHVVFSLSVLANEQTVGANDITVRGLHVRLEITLTPPGGPTALVETEDIVIGETACGVVPGAEILPTFTG